MRPVTRAAAIRRTPVHSPFQRFVESLLPWYDVEVEARRDARTEAIRLRAIAARIAIEQLSPAARRRAARAHIRGLAE